MEKKVYEVFRQERDGKPFVHSGNVEAPDDALALQYAREMFGRRGESFRLWVVLRDAVLELSDRDLLSPALDRSFRTVQGYRLRDKLAAAQGREAGT